MNKRIISVVFLVFLFASVLVAGAYVGVKAYSGNIFGRKQGYGYFKNNYAKGSTGKGGYVLSGGVSKTSVSSLISFLKSKNKDTESQNGTGAAFIVYTMLGKSGKDRNKDISDGDWKDLEARLISLDSKGNIDWSETVSMGIQSYHQEYINSKNKTVHDDAFYSNGSSEKSIAFYNDKGDLIYALAHKCANPMGKIGLPEPNDWSVSTETKSSVATALPGDEITWTHIVKNKKDSRDATDTKIKYHYQNQGVLGSGTGSDHTVSPGLKPDHSEQFSSPEHPSKYIVNQNDVGKYLCRSTVASPKAWNDKGPTELSAACVYIPYNYAFTPNIIANIDAVETGASFNVTPSITPNDDPRRTISQDTNWHITQIVVKPKKPIPHVDDDPGISDGEPCGDYFKNSPDVSCSYLIGEDGSGKSVFHEDGTYKSGTLVEAKAVTAGDYEAGTYICYTFSIKPWSSIDGRWAHSKPECLVIGKMPKVQILGGDIWAKGLIQTSISDKSIAGASLRFGSWGEYGVSAYGLVMRMASGSAFAGSGLAYDIKINNACDYSKITFTNAGNSTCGSSGSVIGNYISTHKIPDVAASFVVNTNDATHNLGDSPTIDLSANNLQGSYRAIGDITVTGGGLGKVISKGQWIVINAPTANVTISGDINYTSEVLRSIADIPQVVIIAKTITIAASVQNIDAWLIAVGDGTDGSGIINTCSDATLPDGRNLTIDICKLPLVVNGPVMSDKIYLYRTAGSGTGTDHSGDPAEVFNLRADVYLWALSRAGSGSHVQTVHTIELPPRY